MVLPFSDKRVVHTEPYVLFGTVYVLSSTYLFRITANEVNELIGLIHLN